MEFPNSDVSLRCVVNMNQWALYNSDYKFEMERRDRYKDAALVTDVSANGDGAKAKYYSAVSMVTSGSPPYPMVGSYFSGGRVDPEVYAEKRNQHPRAALRPDEVVPTILPTPVKDEPVFWEIHDHMDAMMTAEAIAKAVEPRNVPLIFLDNIYHHGAQRGGGGQQWDFTCVLLGYLKAMLNRQDKLLMANIAAATWGWNDRDHDLLIPSVDGAAFEMPFHPNAREHPARVSQQIASYRKMLDAGLCVVLMPLVKGADRDELAKEREFIARWVMEWRKPGDKVFVACPQHELAPWAYWPRDGVSND